MGLPHPEPQSCRHCFDLSPECSSGKKTHNKRPLSTPYKCEPFLLQWLAVLCLGMRESAWGSSTF